MKSLIPFLCEIPLAFGTLLKGGERQDFFNDNVFLMRFSNNIIETKQHVIIKKC